MFRIKLADRWPDPLGVGSMSQELKHPNVVESCPRICCRGCICPLHELDSAVFSCFFPAYHVLRLKHAFYTSGEKPGETYLNVCS